MNGQFQAKDPYTCVVAATDGSELGAIALKGAAQLAARTGVELRVIHIAGDLAGHDAAIRQVGELLADQPHTFEVRNLIAGTPMTPSGLIGQFAEEVGAAVVVVGTRGRSGMGAALLGSTAAELVSRPNRTTIVYGPRAGEPAEVSTVVACVDGSAFSELSVQEGARWAASLRAPLVIVQVVPPDLGTYVEAFEAVYVQNLSTELAGLGSSAESKVLHALSPAEAIIEAFGIDPSIMLVMATHGRVGFKRVAIGSVASEVVRVARGPVVLVHPDESIAAN